MYPLTQKKIYSNVSIFQLPKLVDQDIVKICMYSKNMNVVAFWINFELTLIKQTTLKDLNIKIHVKNVI